MSCEKQKSLQSGTCLAFGSAFKIPLIVKLKMPNPVPLSGNCDVVTIWNGGKNVQPASNAASSPLPTVNHEIPSTPVKEEPINNIPNLNINTNGNGNANANIKEIDKLQGEQTSVSSIPNISQELPNKEEHRAFNFFNNDNNNQINPPKSPIEEQLNQVSSSTTFSFPKKQEEAVLTPNNTFASTTSSLPQNQTQVSSQPPTFDGNNQSVSPIPDIAFLNQDNQ